MYIRFKKNGVGVHLTSLLWIEWDTRSVFGAFLVGLNLEFFSKIKAKEPKLPYYLLIVGHGENR